MGMEPLSDQFTVQWLMEQMQGKKQKVKTFLLDQHVIAGIGNIYADEILFQAGIHPEALVCNLADEKNGGRFVVCHWGQTGARDCIWRQFY